MEYVKLGRSGVKVSRICLGTMNFGPLTSEADGCTIMDRALELGINFFDTANGYGGKSGEGITEQIVGRWLAQGGRRDHMVLATKVYGRMGTGPNERGLSAYHIQRACEDSLRRLRTDRIDLYQLHHVDRDISWDEIWQTLERLISQGKVLYVGSSNFAGWHIVQANLLARQRHFMGLVSEQSLYNLNRRMIELEVIPACTALGVGILPWSPLDRGLLGGILGKVATGRRAAAQVQQALEKHRGQLERHEAFCRELGHEPADVALAWLLHNPAVTAPIVGPRTLDQFTTSLRALEVKLDREALGILDAIWPGPGGPAPEAYAW